MPLSSYELASQKLTSQILDKDLELMAKIHGKNIYVNEIYQIYRQRLLLYDKALTMPLSEIDRLLLNSKRANVVMELSLFRFRQNVEMEISQLISRIQELEIQLSDLKEKI
ncbi:hypothetical protein [Candidatus Nitrosocosmicus hydrocola]|uniref:hypothetical protein n=1 Tax=Candidatus Nitrosocosmicus hydrocola TaxID=1826872 RepID=UPI0011E5BA45|nr:hypothetical protein [Candidatus Nitrosocosmicus hydrocola]